jgi:hypothetical protein
MRTVQQGDRVQVHYVKRWQDGLVPPGQETLVGAALKAGARSCLVLPIHPKAVAGMVANARAGNRPGRHTLGLDRAQEGDLWQEEGGEA